MAGDPKIAKQSKMNFLETYGNFLMQCSLRCTERHGLCFNKKFIESAVCTVAQHISECN